MYTKSELGNDTFIKYDYYFVERFDTKYNK